jgi:electron transfer flavoprotein beta subunit
MKIIVCIKQVPNTKEIRIDPETGTMIRKGVPSIINPDDKHALEAALALKDTNPAEVHVTVLSMGPMQAKDALMECLCMGADEAVLLSDRAFGGADTWATAHTLAAAIRKMGAFDLILCGQQAIDGDTAQVGPQLADRLNLPQVTYAQALSLEDNTLTVERQMEDGYQVIRTALPALVTATRKLNQPRYMNVRDIVRVTRLEEPVRIMGLADIDIDPSEIGLKGSPTRVKRSFSPTPGSEVRFLEGDPTEMATALLTELRDLTLVKK